MTDDRTQQIEQAIAAEEAAGRSWTNQTIFREVGGNYAALAAYLKQRRRQTSEAGAVAVLEAEEALPALAAARPDPPQRGRAALCGLWRCRALAGSRRLAVCRVLAATGARQAAMTPLACRHCGTCDTPVVAPGVGPHAAAARCRACGAFIKWLARVIVGGKELGPMAGVNRVILCGHIGQYGVTVKYAPNGTPCASFTVVVSEHGQDAKVHSTFIDCECWGKKAEAASEIEAGTLVLFEGKLTKRRKGEQWELCVSSFDVTPLGAPVATGPGSMN